MIKVKYNSNIGIKHFYNIFKSRKKRYPKRYFFSSDDSYKKIYTEPIFFKKIIGTYFDIFFEDFYSHNDPQYFPLSGEIIKARGKGFYKNKTSYTKTESIIWIWFLRPAMNYVTNLKIHKLQGTTSPVYHLENKYKENYDIGLFPTVNSILKELNSTNKLHV